MEIQKYRYFDQFNGTMHYSVDFSSVSAFFMAYEMAQEGENNCTLMQFTGFRGIYKEDIIRSYDSKGKEILHVVAYDSEEMGYVGEFVPKNDINPSCRIRKSWIEEFEKEVIGNIHQNPELIK